MSCYPEPDSHIRDEVKVVLDLSNYAAKRELEHTTSIVHLIYLLKNILLLWKLNLTNEKLINLLMFQLVSIIKKEKEIV